MCTGPDAPLQRVLQAYPWRWDIEVNFRDQKTLLGVGQAQVRNPQAVQRVPATAVAAYALLLLAAVQTFGPTGSPHTLPPPAWRRHGRPQRAATVQLHQPPALGTLGAGHRLRRFTALQTSATCHAQVPETRCNPRNKPLLQPDRLE